MLQSTVQHWAAEFKRGRESLEDDPRSGRPVTAITQENIDRVTTLWDHMVMDNRRLAVNQIANAVGISRERLENILHNKLGMSKVSARWVPRLLTPYQKYTRLVRSQANLALLKQMQGDAASFLERFLTQDECWVHTSRYRPSENTCSGNIPLLPLQRRPRWCHRQGRLWPPSSVMQRALR